MRPSASASSASSELPEAAASFDEPLFGWLDAMAAGRGSGGKTDLARELGVTISHFSHLTKRRRGFDEKTVRLMSLIESSKAAHYPDARVVATTVRNGLVVEKRLRDGEDEPIYTWRVA